MTVGVAISTYKRPKVLAEALKHWAQFMPDVLVVINDVAGAGVAMTKNRGIAALMDADCDHLFLCDDDLWPVRKDWASLYVSHSEPHLMHCWGRSRSGGTDGDLSVWTWPRGPMLYVERRVIERVGGMRTEFGRWGGEHMEWSRRIHDCGFTRHRYADLVAARSGVWFSTDYRRTVPSTFPESERVATTAHRHELYEKYRGSTDFVEYR